MRLIHFPEDLVVTVPVVTPDGDQYVILARMDKLSPQCHEALTAAAVLGPLFTLPVLQGVIDAPVDDPLRDLQRLDLIRETRRWPQPEYGFRHGLIQETAYRSLVQLRRQQLHERAARAIEALFPERSREDAVVLANHWREAGNAERALAYLRLAGDEARGLYALPAADERYTEAMEEAARASASPAEFADLHLRRGRVRYESGRYAEARADFEAALGAARDAETPALELQALEGLGSLLFHWGGRPGDAILHFEDALRGAGQLRRLLVLARHGPSAIRPCSSACQPRAQRQPPRCRSRLSNEGAGAGPAIRR